MSAKPRHTVLYFLFVVIGLSVAAYLSWFAAKNRPMLPAYIEDQDLAVEGKKLKGFVLGTEGLLSDWYWMSSLQYLGNKLVRTKLETVNIEDLKPLNPRLLYPYLDNATDLDPRFLDAYYYGAVVLPAIDPLQAINLTEKGIGANPNDWRLYQYLGYIHWRLKDYQKAAETYEKGAQLAAAPPFMKMMAASMQNQGGSRATARAMYTQMYDDASDSSTRENARLRLMQLDSLDERDALAKAIESFRERSGRCPVTLTEIIPFLRMAKPASGKDFRVDGAGNIVDPDGVPYKLDQSGCTVNIGPESRVPRV